MVTYAKTTKPKTCVTPGFALVTPIRHASNTARTVGKTFMVSNVLKARRDPCVVGGFAREPNSIVTYFGALTSRFNQSETVQREQA